jgi:hypothetical protein
MAYTDIASYMQFIDTINNDFLLFCKYLALSGLTLHIYKNRVVLLRTIFKTDADITNTTRCNVTLIITSYLKNAQSAIKTITYSNKCPISKILHDLLISLKLTNKFKNLEKDIKTYMTEKIMKCSDCNGIKKTALRSLGEHLFIEMDSKMIMEKIRFEGRIKIWFLHTILRFWRVGTVRRILAAPL